MTKRDELPAYSAGVAESRCASRIFSTDVVDWYVSPNRKVAKPIHYIPHGVRSTWSYPQWVVYKEEQKRWRISHSKAKGERAKEVAAAARLLRAKTVSKVTTGSSRRQRQTIAFVAGLRDGQRPPLKDDRGVPIQEAATATPDGEGDTSEADDSEEEQAREPLSQFEGVSGEQADAGSMVHGLDSTAPLLEANAIVAANVGIATHIAGVDIDIRLNNWLVPDSDDDYVSDVEREYTDKGFWKVWNHWPSTWRARASYEVNCIVAHKTVRRSSHTSDRANRFDL
jgi:hypothetical protein